MHAEVLPTAPGRVRPPRTLLSAYAVSQFGNWLFRTGVVYFAYNQSHGSAALLTTVIALVYLPILVGSRILAPLADRRDTRRTLIGLDILRALTLCILLATTVAGGAVTTGATITAMAVLSLLTPLFTASQTAYLRQTLPTDGMPAALAGVTRIDWIMFVLGTASAPLMLQISNLPTLIMLDIVTFVVSALLLVRLPPAPVHPAGAGSPDDATTGTGRVRLALSSRWLLAAVFALNAGAGVINVYPNVVARNYLGGGAAWLSVINLANGVGAVIGSTLAGRVSRGHGLRPGILAAVAVAVSLVGMTFVTTAWIAVLASTTMLLAGQVFAVVFQSRILADEPVDRAGRASGLFTLGTFAGVTVSVLLFLGLTAFGPPHRSFTVLLLLGAGTALISALIGQVASRRFGAGVPVTAAAAARLEPAPTGRDVEAEAPRRVGLVRGAGRTFATGVTVVSTLKSLVPHAATVNSFVTVSLDPALVSICVDRTARLHALLEADSPLGITILSAAQRDAAMHFADRHRALGQAQFDGHPWRQGKETGAPLLEEGHAWLECRVERLIIAGDHSIVLARVLSFATADPDDGHGPLVFAGGRFRTLPDDRSEPGVTT
ncbi:MFS transporter [Micromonospora ureilytica]|uniref:Flavin reductase (DIM6/NTAB) family NADH-FMN oxidoreductase RutF/predicted MFS family arabinose efflux permease n=1 Tax=Micromonospora ureilytica TaxID=709868 RepID=A0ABS0JBW9_9ACTN|nr:MFS transporter [Micromonospora ureilytica]MBG6064449.1 flavin reductase (DIM6/NTAB) family NADH-FMN oxidoreductase RutF/predicted MFS family arabinose efflux permease [Micromonospora ureilytica]WSR55891.1 MFS transporter [Micromonospora ureilytica]